MRRTHVAGDVEPLGLLRLRLRAQAQLVDLRTARRSTTSPPVVERGEEVVGVGVGVLDEARDVAVVVLQRLLLAAVEAALDAEHEHDDHDQADAERDERGAP